MDEDSRESGDISRIDDSAGDSELRTFLIADVRGYTSFTQRHGDEAAAKLAAKFARVARDVVSRFQGTGPRVAWR
jgi:class 3 adenylate cyclase